MGKYTFQKQYDTIDCGPSCLKMIADFHGRSYSLEQIREMSFIGREGVSLPNISGAAEKLGFRTMMACLSFQHLIEDCPLPCILHWNQDHYVVLYEVKKTGGIFRKGDGDFTTLIVADPAHGIVELDKESFLDCWLSSTDEKGIVLLLEPTQRFFQAKSEKTSKGGFRFIFQYLLPYRKYIFQLVIGMLAASMISLAFPFFTQLLIDVGIADKNVPLIYMVLASQLFLFLGSICIDLVRSWLLLHINTRISLNIISDFLAKLLNLPMRFFDSKAVGDLSQRINDHHRIETFLTGSFLSSVFSMINIIVFTAVLAYYDPWILSVFILLSVLGLCWVFLFQARRKNLDYKRFARNRENQDKLFEMITGMQEIKLFGAETTTRWKWEQLQVKYFKLNIDSLSLEQSQQAGYVFFTHLKNILITFLAVNGVVQGKFSLGVLLSISYIIGQTNGPIEQLVAFIKSAQDARLSMDRLREIHDKPDEPDGAVGQSVPEGDIVLDHVSFQYEGPSSPFVLKDVSLVVPKGKTTAIVGSSGSGKTTLLKLLLNYYKPVQGEISIGGTSLDGVSPRQWRERCGTVMQDGYIFYDTIANNIALDGLEIDDHRMQRAVKTANLTDFIDGLPLGYTTKIGSSGVGISGGQRQRILIARAVYKDPDYIFLDEATSSLDANNERTIIDNLNEFFIGKTVVVIAHRLSTVMDADQIVMLENGKLIELGDHDTLCRMKGRYYELVRNQLQLAR